MLLDHERSLEKWLKFEYHALNKNLVTQKVVFSELLKIDSPKAYTKAGDEYKFNLDSLNKFSKAVPLQYHRKLRLPIYFYRDLRVKDSCFLSDDLIVKVLKHTKDLDSMYKLQDDNIWLSLPLAHEIANNYPTLFQFVVF